MKKSLIIILFIVVIILVGVASYILLNQQNTNNYLNSCEKLSDRLDENIVDTNNPPGRFSIQGYEGTVGGTLVNIKDNGLDRDYQSYTLAFRGKNAEGELYLITQSSDALPYQIGQFYKFDLSNRNQYSAALSGSFIDNDLNKLVPVAC